MGKFTQSVRRIVQDVKDEGTSSGQTKEEVIETNERLRIVRIRLDGSYEIAKRALVELMCKYTDSKQVRNVFQRYNLLKLMIKDVIKLETQYWTLVDIPKQEKQETVPAFVLRACSIMEKTHKSGEGVKTSARLAEEADTKRERIERLESPSVDVGEGGEPETSLCKAYSSFAVIDKFAVNSRTSDSDLSSLWKVI
ncbi:hypothetical protein E2986_13069 [Frieseomelitta varia]|uniref:Uncharacterized protein n=1 Tax=Frieseomelitta varia TaxID=561572 RepID=A0A833VV49_9HYME|nr:hypothetical protein E2986_13069 [Frieseomelitta varia]